MKLQPGENIIKIYHHDFLSFVFRSLKIWGATLPFFLLAYIFGQIMPVWMMVSTFAGIILLFALVNLYDFMMFYLDTLIITNQRLVHLDWISPFKYTENQAMLNDIQNIESEENGFLSRFPLFDYGLFRVETASTKTVISFDDAPDPEGIKFFVVNLARKHVALQENIPLNDVRSLHNHNQKIENTSSKVASLD